MDKVVIYNVGLYCRLSLDDGNVGESGSIPPLSKERIK